MLELAIAGNWASLTVAPGVHPAAMDMVLAPTGRAALTLHFSTGEVQVQVGAVVLWPVIV